MTGTGSTSSAYGAGVNAGGGAPTSEGHWKRTILVVDDEPTTLLLLADSLSRRGFDVVKADTMSAAKAAVAHAALDLAILDVCLPDGNGLELCKWIKSQPQTEDLPVLMLSADEDVVTKVASFDAGASDYITKPFQGAELMARVKTHLRLHDAYRAMIAAQAEKLLQLTHAQRAMMPRSEDLPEAQFCLHYEPLNEAGGDLCQVVRVGPRVHDYVIADVCGHDIASAMTTAALQALFQQNCSLLYSPVEILRIVNRVARSLVLDGQYVTGVYARLNRKSGLLTLSNAGHPPAILHRAGGEVEAIQLEGDIVGAFESPVFDVVELRVRPGDRLFLYSDSLVERGMGVGWMHGTEGIIELCRRCSDIPLEETLNRLADLARVDGRISDDTTILGVVV